MQLKILACNVSGGELQGTIQVNGQLVHPKEFRNQSAVVWQSDVLLSSSTVSRFSAPASAGFTAGTPPSNCRVSIHGRRRGASTHCAWSSAAFTVVNIGSTHAHIIISTA